MLPFENDVRMAVYRHFVTHCGAPALKSLQARLARVSSGSGGPINSPEEGPTEILVELV